MRTLGTIISFTYTERFAVQRISMDDLDYRRSDRALLWIPKLVSEFSSGEKGTVLVEDPLKLVSGAEELSKGVSADYRWESLNGDKRESALERLKQEEEVKGVVTLGEAGGLPVLDIAVRKKDDLPLVEELTRFVRERSRCARWMSSR
ncbi:hypothetical protein LJK88_28675 [Paenibacillus sp. P26]|nr:hypothetical protein LJK88_28675 [Paenibacillus sp. P26]